MAKILTIGKTYKIAGDKSGLKITHTSTDERGKFRFVGNDDKLYVLELSDIHTLVEVRI